MLTAFVLLLSSASRAGADAAPPPGSLHLTPAFVTLADGRTVSYQEGVLFVPENRRAENPRTVAIRFRRFPAREDANGPPVFYLPGGPGGTIDDGELASEDGRRIVDFFTSVGPLVIVDQRGNAAVDASFVPAMEMAVSGLPLDAVETPADRKAAYRRGFRDALERWSKRGLDLAGYDIHNAVADVEALRAALGYDEIVLRGNSFGSQWSFAYLKRHPEHVARALLGGVEPLNHAYDRPAHVWAAHRRIIDLVEADPDLAPHLPDAGLERAIRTLLEDLADEPRRVALPHPERDEKVTVAIGRYDVQRALKRFAPNYYKRRGLEKWPRFILELLEGDLRYLAALTIRRRQAERIPLIFPLIDNSLGVTAKRERALRGDAARQIVGPINAFYEATRGLTPTREVSDAFRTELDADVPVLMIQGDLDRSTPIENARHIDGVLPRSHLLHVENGTHMAIREIRRFHPEVTETVRAFLRTGLLADIPERVTIPAPDFQEPGEKSLFAELDASARIAN